MANKIYYTALEVAEMLNISRTSGYTIVRKLNNELESQGYLTVHGKISTVYFNKKWYGLNETIAHQVSST